MPETEKEAFTSNEELVEKSAEETKVTGQWRGFPFKGKAPSIKASDPDYLLPMMDHDVHVKVFRTWDDAEMTEYGDILKKIVKGTALPAQELQEYDQTHGGWRIFLKWTEPFFRNRTRTEMSIDALRGQTIL